MVWRFSKIGIRPIIDGRRKGVRESLENQTMSLAKAAARLLARKLRYPNGAPVECVIADTCIGGVAEAAQAAAKFAREGVGVSLSVTPCWCYGSETMDMDPLMPKAVWGFNGTERPGAVYLAAVLAAHNQKGLPAFSIYGRDVQDSGDTAIPADVQEKMLRFARAGLAAAIMRGKSYVSMGNVSMGIAGSMVDQSFFENYLGMRVKPSTCRSSCAAWTSRFYDKAEFEKGVKWAKKHCNEGKDGNPKHCAEPRPEGEGLGNLREDVSHRARHHERQSQAARMGWVKKPSTQRPRRDSGQRQWTDHFPNGDFMEAC